MLRPKQLKQYSAQCLAEFFGTFIFVFVGNLSVAQAKLSTPPVADSFGVNLAFATGIYLGIMVAGPISGGHINPGVSVGLLSLRKIKIIQCLFYVIGQILGGFLAGAMVYIMYYSKITEFEKTMGKMDISNGPGSIFYTVPNGAVPNWNCFIDSVVGTSLLLIFIMALGNDYNNLVSNPAKPFGFALVLTTFGFSMGLNCGNPINPARDFGPRLFAACLYGRGVFSTHEYYFWVPVIGPIVGAIAGVWIFEGYLILMKKYANLPGIIHIGSVEQPNQGIPQEKPPQIATQISDESRL